MAWLHELPRLKTQEAFALVRGSVAKSRNADFLLKEEAVPINAANPFTGASARR